MMVTINGEAADVLGQTVQEYLNTAGYASKRVAIELNGAILPAAQFATYRFKAGDRVEIVHFVGGG